MYYVIYVRKNVFILLSSNLWRLYENGSRSMAHFKQMCTVSHLWQSHEYQTSTPGTRRTPMEQLYKRYEESESEHRGSRSQQYSSHADDGNKRPGEKSSKQSPAGPLLRCCDLPADGLVAPAASTAALLIIPVPASARWRLPAASVRLATP